MWMFEGSCRPDGVGDSVRAVAGAAGLVAACWLLPTPAAEAAVIYEQKPASTGSSYASDRDSPGLGASPQHMADNFQLASPATVRSVTWRGGFSGSATLSLPLSFDVIFYANQVASISGVPRNVPNPNSVVGMTTVSVPSTAMTGIGGTRFEFEADITPIALAAGTTYWLSIVADTRNDANDNFGWIYGAGGDGHASLTDLGFAMVPTFFDRAESFYWVLDDAAIPEPASLTLLLLGAAAVASRGGRRA